MDNKGRKGMRACTLQHKRGAGIAYSHHSRKRIKGTSGNCYPLSVARGYSDSRHQNSSFAYRLTSPPPGDLASGVCKAWLRSAGRFLGKFLF